MKVMPLAARAVLSVIALAVAILLFGLAGMGRAETRCGGYADVLADLRASYGETSVWEGEVGTGQRLVVTAAPDGSTWTALVIEGSMACLLSSGRSWSGVARPAGEDI